MFRSKGGGSQHRTGFTATYILLMVAVILVCLLLVPSPAAAQNLHLDPTPTPNPDSVPLPDFPQNMRSLYNLRTTVYHHWMLTSVAEQKVSCNIYMAVIGEPADSEVLGYCGFSVYLLWQQGVCKQSLDREEPCTGLTLHYIGPIEDQLKISIKLPGALAYAKLSNCSPWGTCSQHPQMIFGGYEPLANHQINRVTIKFEDGQEFICNGRECSLDMPFTNADGMQVTYYVSSTYGDNSLQETFQVRNINLADGTFLFQLIDSPWDNQIPIAAAQWEFFPSLDIDKIEWLRDISSPDELQTAHDFALLAGVLILRGDVSAANCSDGGLLPNMAASACGLEAARADVSRIQNKFNQQILDAAIKARVPAKLLKGIIGQESQFWNGWVIKGEYGYGMMTDEGADLLLTYDIRTFLDLCIPVFGERNCAWGYTNLAEYPRAYLRGLALQDLRTDKEFELIAKTLAAAAGQAGQIVRNVTGEEPGDVLNYKELWQISAALYHGGGGCVGTAIDDAWQAESSLSWGVISEYLIGDCQLVATYPYLVTRYAVSTP
ncbi:MAG TPA: hypothetical protein DCY42_05665 [Chloroflexi bacterium]|nr:hypothetical protein [Chloroflexota bacterium]